MKIENKIKKFEKLLKEIQDKAKKQYIPSSCPLRHNHYALSEIIFGQGCWHWTCGFCGETFEE